MTTRLISYAQNGEDVVLWRALKDVESGTYLDIGANDPQLFSVTRSFYDHGWSGLCVEPQAELVEKFRAERPRDHVLQGVISDSSHSRLTFYLIPDSGLSTLREDIASEHREHGWRVDEITVDRFTLVDAVTRAGLLGRDIHFAVIDTEGAESQVLRSAGFTDVRPWILVIEATAPLSTRQVHVEWEQVVLDAGYRFCLFDGLSRFYVDAREHPELIEKISYPAGVFDDYITSSTLALEQRAIAAEGHVESARAEVEGLRRSLSWRLTAPLRAVRRATRPGHTRPLDHPPSTN